MDYYDFISTFTFDICSWGEGGVGVNTLTRSRHDVGRDNMGQRESTIQQSIFFHMVHTESL